jgi:hypothetical protein
MQRVSRRRRVLYVAVALGVAVGACSSTDDTADSEPSSSSTQARFGAAQVAPATVSVGDRFTVTPHDEIQPICLDAAVILQTTNSDQERIGILSSDGLWQGYDMGPDPTVAACRPPESADAQSYEVPPDLRSGEYIVCLTWEPTEAGCGVFTVGD